MLVLNTVGKGKITFMHAGLLGNVYIGIKCSECFKLMNKKINTIKSN